MIPEVKISPRSPHMTYRFTSQDDAFILAHIYHDLTFTENVAKSASIGENGYYYSTIRETKIRSLDIWKKIRHKQHN